MDRPRPIATRRRALNLIDALGAKFGDGVGALRCCMRPPPHRLTFLGRGSVRNRRASNALQQGGPSQDAGSFFSGSSAMSDIILSRRELVEDLAAERQRAARLQAELIQARQRAALAEASGLQSLTRTDRPNWTVKWQPDSISQVNSALVM